jgi:hypothetical protein
MNDDFLHQYQKPPRREFVDSLYKKISQKDRSKTTMLNRSLPALNRLAFALSVLGLAFTLALASSPSARAKFLEVIQDVGGLAYIQTTEYPGGSGPERIFPEKTMTLEQARQIFPAAVELPTYTPEGYTLNTEDVTVMVSSE